MNDAPWDYHSRIPFLCQGTRIAAVESSRSTHAFATLGLVGGMAPKTVSEHLGHSSIVITLDLYSHVLPNMQEELVIVVAQALAASLDKPLEWAVGFFFGNVELSLELWTVIAGISGLDD